MFKICFTFILLIVSNFCFADIKKIYSYEKVEQVANYLGARIENPDKKILSCDAAVEKSTLWLSGPVHEMLDSKRPDEIKKFKQNPKSYMSQVRGCSARCTCNAYNMMLSDLSEESNSKEFKDFDALLTTETKKLTKDQSLKCAQKLYWFCKSKFHSYLLLQ